MRTRGTIRSVDTSAPYRATPEQEGDSQSSSSNSPTRADYEESDFYNGNNDSESSIGGTFQDMAVSEESCTTPANRLPAEVLIGIFSKLSSPNDLLNCMRVSKRWARNVVDQLWHRPSCTTWEKLSFISRTLSLDHPYFAYRDFIKRLNLASLSDPGVNDGSVQVLSVCTRVERLTLTNCDGITDSGLIGLLTDSHHLLALDISGDTEITAASMLALAEHCRRLQGLNISGCYKISSESMITVAENCRFIKRLKLNDCAQMDDTAIMAFAMNCPNILEIDLQACKNIGNEPITALLMHGQSLRELRLSNCELISDSAFLELPLHQTYEHLRILDLTSCARLTDRAVERIIDVAPRLRNVVFAKCRNLTDLAVHAVSKLGKNLHYLHLGHCGHITDNAVSKLVQACNRIRYIDLGCCVHITDASVTKLASLPKLRRVGLVKCNNITDESVLALAQHRVAPANMQSVRRDRPGQWVARREDLPADAHYAETMMRTSPPGGSSLERIHLSYCTNLTLNSIVVLLNNCQKLTHLSLTGVQAFLRDDLERFCRPAPPEFTEHQRSVFCVFSGIGVSELRNHLNGLGRPQRLAHQNHNGFRGGLAAEDDDQFTPGPVNGIVLNTDDDIDADEELDDAETSQLFVNGDRASPGPGNT